MSTPTVAQPAPLTTEQKILQSIAEVSAVAASITQRFGHNNAASLISTIPQFGLVFAGLFDSIRGLFSHPSMTPANQNPAS